MALVKLCPGPRHGCDKKLVLSAKSNCFRIRLFLNVMWHPIATSRWHWLHLVRAVEPPPWLPPTPKTTKGAHTKKKEKDKTNFCQAKPSHSHRCGYTDSGHRASAGSTAHACMRLLRAACTDPRTGPALPPCLSI